MVAHHWAYDLSHLQVDCLVPESGLTPVLVSSVILTFICSYTVANNLYNNKKKKEKICNVHILKH